MSLITGKSTLNKQLTQTLKSSQLVMNRRDFFKHSLSAFALVSVAPKEVFALWNKRAFKESNYQKALKATFGSTSLIPSKKISLEIPKVASNSATVPLEVKCDLKGVKELAVFVEKNKSPLTLHLELTSKMLPMVSTRIKMRESSMVHVVAKVGGKLYTVSQQVKVNAQAC